MDTEEQPEPCSEQNWPSEPPPKSTFPASCLEAAQKLQARVKAQRRRVAQAYRALRDGSDETVPKRVKGTGLQEDARKALMRFARRQRALEDLLLTGHEWNHVAPDTVRGDG
jgi:hypothetical protein